MKRKTKSELRTYEWADFKAILYGIEQRIDRPQSARIARLIELLSLVGDTSTNKTKRVNSLTELRTALSRYQWSRTINPSTAGLIVVTRPKTEGLSRDDVWEHETAAALLDLAMLPNGASCFRRCEIKHCPRWFFASARKDQRFCSSKCRQYHYDNTEERIEARRASGRKAQSGYRTREKEKDAEAKRAAGYQNPNLAKLRKLRQAKP